jgi:RNA polymerase sigma factor (sigma-70 family)
MTNRTLRSFVSHLRVNAAVERAGRLTDVELVERFVHAHDEAAFEVLVWRYGRMVLNVCRRLLRSEHDAEDAFQATFLLLARKATTVRNREALGSWLHKVACRVARAASVPQSTIEGVTPADGSAGPVETVLVGELRTALDEEVSRLPEKYRIPVVLCCLEGKSNREAAQQLRCPEATLRTRLARARERLRARLARRGLSVAGGVLTTALVSSEGRAATPGLVAATVNAALGMLGSHHAVADCGRAALLADRVVRTMIVQKIKHALVAVVVVGVLGTGVGLSARQALAAKGDTDSSKPAGQPQPPAPEAKENASADLREMRGTWTMMRTERIVENGKPLPAREKKVTFVIDDNRFVALSDDGMIGLEFTFTIDPNQKPKSIDMLSRQIEDYLGIYELAGDSLKINLDPKVGKRPTDFSADAAWGYWDLKRVSRTPLPVKSRFPNPPGCFWVIEPRTEAKPASLMSTVGFVYSFSEDRDGAAVVTLASGIRNGSGRREYRPVLLDDQNNRYLPKSVSSASSERRDGVGVGLSKWRMDPKVLPANKVAHIGIEEVTTDAHRIAAREALEQAQREGIEVMPYPEIGKPFDFNLTALDGKKVSTQNLHGKVILIDCWATWCSPCMALLPEVKSVYENHHKDGLEVIGVSWDNQPETVTKTCKRLALDWPQVVAPSDEKKRTIWDAASGIHGIPRLLLIDRDGVLRADFHGNLEEEVKKLLSAPKPAAVDR